ncbi:MAG: hypothetical protein GY869_28555, partial [Planctomycetes bacterium]|nr:hypothetical protein [Planctomycetota bacterium]
DNNEGDNNDTNVIEKTWKEFFPENRINKEIFTQKWYEAAGTAYGDDLWEYLSGPDVNWLAAVDDDEDGETDPGRAKIVDKDERKMGKLADPRFKDQEDIVETILDRYSEGIDPVVTDAVFTGPQEYKEGWLKLRRVPGRAQAGGDK